MTTRRAPGPIILPPVKCGGCQLRSDQTSYPPTIYLPNGIYTQILSAKGVVAIFMIAMANALYAQQDKKETNTATADKYAQMFSEPDTVQPCRALNKKIYSAVNAIDAMPLRCDSIFVDEAGSFGRKHFYIGKRLFFDSNNRLRKYRTYKREGSDDADYRIYRFYYDENGKLIYSTII